MTKNRQLSVDSCRWQESCGQRRPRLSTVNRPLTNSSFGFRHSSFGTLIFPHDVGQKPHIAGAEDGPANGALELRAIAGAAAGQHVPVAGDHDLQGPQVLVVDVYR